VKLGKGQTIGELHGVGFSTFWAAAREFGCVCIAPTKSAALVPRDRVDHSS